jgi:cephalosporin hydroxylase
MFYAIRKIVNEFNATREYKRFAPIIHESTRNLTSDQLVDFVLSKEWERFFWMIQIPSEIKWLLGKVDQIKPRVVVEIGTKMGGTLFLFTKVSSRNSSVISIDFPDGHGGGYSKAREAFYKSFTQHQQQINLIKGDSHSLNTLDQLKSVLQGQPIDFLFIDGDHSYEGVKLDYEMYSPLVRAGGLIAFHDNKPTASNSWSGVIPFWAEIKNTTKSSEFFGQEDEWGGMGIIEVTLE